MKAFSALLSLTRYGSFEGPNGTRVRFSASFKILRFQPFCRDKYPEGRGIAGGATQQLMASSMPK